ncbi:MAG: aldehyde dehydrogenase family protein [Pseudolysinimonas sp.]
MTASQEPIRVVPFIGGQWRGSGAEFAITDPAAPRRTVATVMRSTPEDVALAYEAARAAAPAWAKTPVHARSRILYIAADLLDARAERIATRLVLEEGKLLRDALGEVRRAAETLRYHAGLAQTPIGSVYPPENSGLSISRMHPVGIVGVITPFNYPILTPAWKIAPALALGNTVVWKCSELTPVTASEFASSFADAGVPPGVLNLVIGAGDIGEALVNGPLDALTFTGSTSVGDQLRVAAAARAVRVQLELGGKNHAIVFDDADPAFAAERIAYGAMSAAGQKCTAIEVAVIQNGIYDEVRKHLVEQVERLRTGHGLDPETSLPPLVSATAAERVCAEISGVQSRGATVLTGGARRYDEGHFVAPTVVENVAPGDEFLRSEVFGPVIALVRCDDDADAIALVNGGMLGLNAGVFARDTGRALAACDALQVGMVHLNDVTGFPPHIPFGGSKASAFGPLEQGDTVREFFTETRMLHLHRHPGAA